MKKLWDRLMTDKLFAARWDTLGIVLLLVSIPFASLWWRVFGCLLLIALRLADHRLIYWRIKRDELLGDIR